VNFAATAVAVKQWARHKISGEPLRWLKTEHAFPNMEALTSYRRKLGDLLIDREGLRREDLAEALALQQVTGEKLGDVLAIGGMVTEQKVARALGQQFALPTVTPHPIDIPLGLLARMPEHDAIRLNALPLGKAEQDVALVAVSSPPASETKAEIEALMGMRVRFAFAGETALHGAREKAYRRLMFDRHSRPAVRLGDRLIEMGLLTKDQLDKALEEQQSTGELLAELLVRKGWVSADSIEAAGQGALHEGFRTITPEEADPDALRELGYGLCALYTMVPLARHHVSGARVAAAYPLHREVRNRIAQVLGETALAVVLAPVVDVRAALAVASRRAWPQGIAGGLGGLDGAELGAIRDAYSWDASTTTAFGASARATGQSPIDHLISLRGVGREEATRLRGRAMGVPVATPPAGLPRTQRPSLEGVAQWLPPGVIRRDEVDVLESRASCLIVASVRPEPPLARQIAALVPDRPVTWRIVEEAGTG
jgi:hypothetical protein